MTFIHWRFNFTGYSLYFYKLIFVILSILAKSSCPQFSFIQILPTFAVLKNIKLFYIAITHFQHMMFCSSEVPIFQANFF